MASKLCYNRGCGKQYNPRENLEEGCQFHPGAPFFHEGFKGWTCCDKKVSSLKTYNILWFCYTYSLTRDLIYMIISLLVIQKKRANFLSTPKISSNHCMAYIDIVI